ncbi:undecaprenyl-phosphate glucose phosphotransferase [Flavobacterium degerlachei]|jgi:undecaprenyl-phosphate galactose phosphotransferase/putative colanic acid biosynthesis UDP-glucose lipid carrier transferase|uniref:Undecaprenyl-phosphate galactose phosphotransferase/putative colanic acid biosysnthesis UDP-glucose lipid carrier transferase n=1 Tax=Flavobacterium degerlachei TaxID=229203 RepID=A0A1H2VN70_9FLAO|nr:undecaprenyl-phosphate glucose phosphotransferase [Flavobacterium degerlachei]SDW69812.1 undecaprenyl-phosphate galactose phosphotransferase/putative colanic acid biosysnthesis UDP-glucose lipid carrier transferase [Flavobacterium degerlachei]
MSLLKHLAAYRFSRYFKLLFALWDLILLNSAILFSFLLRYGSLDRMDLKEVQTISLLTNLFWIFILFYKDAYRIIRIERIETILTRMMRHILIHTSLIAVFVGLLKYSTVSRLRLLYFYLVFFVFLFISRVVFMKFMKYIRAQGYNFKNVIIIGANDKGENIRKFLSRDLTYGYRILGFFDDKVDPFAPISGQLLGGLDAIHEYVVNNNVDEMFIALHNDNLKTIHELTALCERYMIRIKFIPDFQQYTRARKVQISFYGNTPVLMLRKEPLEGMPNLLLKKAFDLVFSFAVIVLIFPWLFPIIILMIKMDSPGPVFFRQRRSGRDNEDFWCVKFRTMQVNKLSDSMQATLGDSRVTKMGAFMRRTNIDELPQFFNVLWGTMSVIGPRPHMLKHTEQYSELINNYLVRHYAKPGISGWAQVNGFRGETKELIEMKDRVDYDIWYIENWSLLLDIKIIYLTVYNIFKGEEKAY